MPAPPTSKLSAEEILGLINELARNGEGADRRWALKQLSVGDAAITLPRPLSEDEMDNRLARILWGRGELGSRRAFAKAFPKGVPISWAIARQRSQMNPPVNLKMLYEEFPEAPMDPLTGAPPGYPKESTQLKKKRWIADYAISLHEQRKANEKGLLSEEASSPPA